MRGARFYQIVQLWMNGIIPADAGSTPRCRQKPVLSLDHPRGCGEHNHFWCFVNSYEGSSPRMRGALLIGFDLGIGERIIPADAGSTSFAQSKRLPSWDHPRGCGEHVCAAIVSVETDLGIIPADAGSTDPHRWPAWCERDHPRGCGEHLSVSYHAIDRGGSSPRMRGARIRLSSLPELSGIIPADAGSTFLDWRWYEGGWDHPRGCGEHVQSEWNSSVILGSSPRMRGARFLPYFSKSR